jgi:lysozyme
MLLDPDRERVRTQLIQDEGIRLKPYQDTVGKTTIGVGRNLDDVGISAMEAYMLLDHDIDRAIIGLVGKFPWFRDQDPVRQAVLVNLCFNMGLKSLSGFVNTLAAFESHNYEAAATGLKKSKWYKQVGASRSSRLIQMTRTGEWP